MSMDARLKRLEYEMIRAEVEPMALEYGINPEELIAECQRFCALSDDEQDAELAAEIAEAEAYGDTESVRILTDGWEALKSARSA
jgi:hypothetical protein